MKKILLIPDSYKGTMSSMEICKIMKKAIYRHFPHAELVAVPVADGGEGSVDAFLAAAGGKKVHLKVKGPYFESLDSFYGVLPDNTAVIEMAAAAGLPLVGENRHAELTTTYGVGQLIRHAAETGSRKIIVGLGGSATNDGGTGAAAALGVRFLDLDGNAFIPVGETLSRIAKIDISGITPVLRSVELVGMCDIDNSLCGAKGAAEVFAPQKGANADMVKLLDRNLGHLADVIERDIGKDIRNIPGAGAAGGMGGGMAAFFGVRLQPGIETVLEAVGFDSLLTGADLVISGEGRIDSQSLRGKVVIGCARRAKAAGIPLIAVVGDIGDHIEEAYAEGVSAIFSINSVAAPFEKARERCRDDLAMTVDNIMRALKLYA
ncbi:glycerate kinase [Ruminiclostridium hungatei]|uniref:Glycerate kinase n=1 Tax=Ruminiclostridium hungatei TaxID=48256 RepID=A0A1V4SJ43_RUMHU|nr:glycerate kinase [Ruminiclostridium hungatei]OPX43485.1 glycerate kinase [Ruminiclostridium hungatei]